MRPQKLEQRFRAGNIADKVENIGPDICRLTKLDDNSRKDWIDKSKHAMDLALQVVEEKTNPWPGASNVKYPLITSAALQFHARAYSSIIQGNKVVKSQITGADPDNAKRRAADRIAQHMNWQLLEENDAWEPDHDRMLLALAIEGCEFKKTYFSKADGYNKSEWVRPVDLIVNNSARSIKTAPRITHRLKFYPYEIDEKMRSGFWSEIDLGLSADEEEDQVEQVFFEQCTYLDPFDDGIKLPYIATVHERSEKVVRLVAGFYPEDAMVEMDGNIIRLGDHLVGGISISEAYEKVKAKVISVPRIEMYTKYGYIPSPDGSFYDIGLGQLIGPISDAVDTNINQLIDAGTLANKPAGFIQPGFSIDGKRGKIQWKMGEFMEVRVPAGRTLGDSIFQFTFKEPSLVLFNLLGTLIQAAKDVTSVQDIMMGASSGQEEKATTSMIRVEQGMKVFSSIYKRIFRSMKQEFKKLYMLNRRNLMPQQYYRILDTGQQEIMNRTDYMGDGTDVQPVADPQLATSMLAFAKNQQLLGIMQHPIINDEDILRRYIEGLEVPHPDTAFIPPEQRQQPPDPLLLLQAQIEASKHTERMGNLMSGMARDYADAIKKLAEAESEEEGLQLQKYIAYLEGLIGMVGGQVGQGNTGGMAQPPNNPGVNQIPGPSGGPMQTGGANQPVGPGPGQVPSQPGVGGGQG